MNISEYLGIIYSSKSNQKHTVIQKLLNAKNKCKKYYTNFSHIKPNLAVRFNISFPETPQELIKTFKIIRDFVSYVHKYHDSNDTLFISVYDSQIAINNLKFKLNVNKYEINIIAFITLKHIQQFNKAFELIKGKIYSDIKRSKEKYKLCLQKIHKRYKEIEELKHFCKYIQEKLPIEIYHYKFNEPLYFPEIQVPKEIKITVIIEDNKKVYVNYYPSIQCWCAVPDNHPIAFAFNTVTKHIYIIHNGKIFKKIFTFDDVNIIETTLDEEIKITEYVKKNNPPYFAIEADGSVNTVVCVGSRLEKYKYGLFMLPQNRKRYGTKKPLTRKISKSGIYVFDKESKNAYWFKPLEIY